MSRVSIICHVFLDNVTCLYAISLVFYVMSRVSMLCHVFIALKDFVRGTHLVVNVPSGVICHVCWTTDSC